MNILTSALDPMMGQEVGQELSLFLHPYYTECS